MTAPADGVLRWGHRSFAMTDRAVMAIVNATPDSFSDAGVDRTLYLPHVGFNREVGVFGPAHITPAGELVGADAWAAQRDRWLPTDVDKTHVRSLMQPVHERGKIAAWIAPPRNGINGKPFDYDYVHLA